MSTVTANKKNELSGYLQKRDFEGLSALNRGKGRLAHTLVGMAYEKEELLTWRAIDAIGRLAADMQPEKLRTFVQRILWMMREESGNNCWTSAEILGEIVARNPGPNEDIALIVVGFHDELILRAGALRALWRIATVRPDLMEDYRKVPAQYLSDPDEQVRGYAVLSLIALGAEENREALERAAADKNEFLLYEDEILRSVSIAELAKNAL